MATAARGCTVPAVQMASWIRHVLYIIKFNSRLASLQISKHRIQLSVYFSLFENIHKQISTDVLLIYSTELSRAHFAAAYVRIVARHLMHITS